jgi:hypothetical protein
MALDRRLLLRSDQALLDALDLAAARTAEPGSVPDRSRTTRVLLWRALAAMGITPPAPESTAPRERAA